MTDKERMPIYYDSIDRRLVDPMEQNGCAAELYPATDATMKLFVCHEAMCDVIEIIEAMSQCQATDKKRRKMKLLFTPLYNLVRGIIGLLNDIQNNQQTKHSLPAGTDSIASQIEKSFAKIVPHGKGQLLRAVRDQMSAHIDDRIFPHHARQIFGGTSIHDIGLWIDACAAVLCDLLKLPIYAWSCDTSDPTLVSRTAQGLPQMMAYFKIEDGHVVAVAGMQLMKKDPRRHIFDRIEEMVMRSRWMFPKGASFIQGFTADQPGDSWAQSLRMLKVSNQQSYRTPVPRRAADTERGVNRGTSAGDS